MAIKRKKGGVGVGRNNGFYGKSHSQAWKKKESLRKTGKKNPMFGKKHSPSTIRKMRQTALNRSK